MRLSFISFSDRRRIGSSNVGVGPSIQANPQPAKKPKLASGVLSRSSALLPASASSQDAAKSWEHIAVDIESIDLVPSVIEANDNDEADKVVCA